MPSAADVARYREKNGIAAPGERAPTRRSESEPAEPIGVSMADRLEELKAEAEPPETPPTDTDDEGDEPTGQPAAPPPAAEPAAEPVVAPAADEWKPPTKDDYEATKAKAKTLDDMEAQFMRAPEMAVEAYFRALTPQQQAVYLQRIGAQPSAPAQEPVYDMPEIDMTPIERLTHHNRDWITQGPARVQNYVEQQFASRDAVLSNAHLQAAVAVEALKHFADALGIVMPAYKADDVWTAVRGGKSVEEAVGAVFGSSMKQAVALRKAAEKPQPTTLREGSTASPPLPKNASMAQIMRDLKKNL